MDELLKAIAAIGIPLALILFAILQWDKVERILGHAWSLVSAVVRFGDRTAVSMRVQGDINTARSVVTRDAPDGLLDSKLKIKWHDAEGAESLVRDGEVVVCMRRSKHHEENMAHALMAFLPKAVLPRARRYVDKDTMRAADLTLAKAILSAADERPGALDVFFEDHLDPAREDADLRERIAEVDEIDLHGWLLRILLPEFRQLGDDLHPSEVDPRTIEDAKKFAGWLHRLAIREPGDKSIPLAYEGRFIRVAVVLVAKRLKLQDLGTEPYRKVAKRLVYSGNYDAVYLLGRDDNMDAVRSIFDRLRQDGRVASSRCHEYRLRADFKKRKLPRDHAILACLRPHQRELRVPVDPGEELPDVEIERFDPEATETEGVGGAVVGTPSTSRSVGQCVARRRLSPATGRGASRRVPRPPRPPRPPLRSGGTDRADSRRAGRPPPVLPRQIPAL